MSGYATNQELACRCWGRLLVVWRFFNTYVTGAVVQPVRGFDRKPTCPAGRKRKADHVSSMATYGHGPPSRGIRCFADYISAEIHFQRRGFPQLGSILVTSAVGRVAAKLALEPHENGTQNRRRESRGRVCMSRLPKLFGQGQASSARQCYRPGVVEGLGKREARGGETLSFT